MNTAAQTQPLPRYTVRLEVDVDAPSVIDAQHHASDLLVEAGVPVVAVRVVGGHRAFIPDRRSE